MVTMIYHKKLGADWQEAAKKLRMALGSCPSSARPHVDIIGRSHKQKIELDSGHVIETLTVDSQSLTYMQVTYGVHHVHHDGIRKVGSQHWRWQSECR